MKPAVRELIRFDFRGKMEFERLHTNINNELENLKTSDPFLPPDSDATRALEVVPVHENVNHEIQRNWNP